jgi:hypothetical protein
MTTKSILEGFIKKEIQREGLSGGDPSGTTPFHHGGIWSRWVLPAGYGGEIERGQWSRDYC